MTFNYTSVQRIRFTDITKIVPIEINLSFCVSELMSMLSVKTMIWNFKVVKLTRIVVALIADATLG